MINLFYWTNLPISNVNCTFVCFKWCEFVLFEMYAYTMDSYIVHATDFDLNEKCCENVEC